MPNRTFDDWAESIGVSKIKKLTFKRWIESFGEKRLALYLKVHPKAIQYWKTGHCDPRVDHMRRIKRLTHGLITYEMMIDRRPITTKGKYSPKETV